MKIAISIMVVTSAIALVLSTPRDETVDCAVVGLGPYLFQIPLANIVDDDVNHDAPQSGQATPVYEEINVVFAADELRTRIPELESGRSALYFTLRYLSDDEWLQYENPSYWADLWYRRGWYRHYVFEPLGASGFVKAHDPRTPSYFFVLRRMPADGEMLPERLSDYFLASCSQRGGEKGSCAVHIVVDEFLISASVSPQDLEALGQLGEFLGEKLASWQVGSHVER